jgi:hypothetical protein
MSRASLLLLGDDMLGPWYERYAEYNESVQSLRGRFLARCQHHGVLPQQVQTELWRDMVARIVHESTWQEDLYLDPVRTKELADAVFYDPMSISGPRLDVSGLVEAHRQRVIRLRREGASIEELASYNLSRALVVIHWVAAELSARQSMSLLVAAKRAAAVLQELPLEADLKPPQHAQELHKLQELLELKKGIGKLAADIEGDESAVGLPLTGRESTWGELAKKWLELDFDSLLHPFKVDYIHFLHRLNFLHRLTVMGTIHPSKCGSFRKKPVHIPANPDLVFCLPAMVPALMQEYCDHFPTILPGTVKYDPIETAARTSYEFVRIHPYSDGNGRVSRLLMNLVLWGHHPPVYLKADKKGRHRYVQALRRADRGNIKPLACLIAMSLVSIYAKYIHSIGDNR